MTKKLTEQIVKDWSSDCAHKDHQGVRKLPLEGFFIQPLNKDGPHIASYCNSCNKREKSYYSDRSFSEAELLRAIEWYEAYRAK